MAKNPNVKTTLEDALVVLSVWKTIPDFKIGDVSLNDFNGAINSTDIPVIFIVSAGVDLCRARKSRPEGAPKCCTHPGLANSHVIRELIARRTKRQPTTFRSGYNKCPLRVALVRR